MRIEKNIPLPKQGGGGSVGTYPFAKMEVGDSVLLDADGNGSRGRASGAARAYAYRSGRKFSVRAQNGGSKVRIWRIE